MLTLALYAAITIPIVLVLIAVLDRLSRRGGKSYEDIRREEEDQMKRFDRFQAEQARRRNQLFLSSNSKS